MSLIDRRCWTVIFALAIGLCALSGVLRAQIEGRWITGKYAPLPETSEEYWSATAGGKLYMFGGTTSVGRGRVVEYDPATNRWTVKQPMPHPANHMAVAEHAGKIYVFGGSATALPSGGQSAAPPGNFQIDLSWEYDPARDSWRALSPMPTRRHAAAAVQLGGKIHVVGGNGYRAGADPQVSVPNGELVVLNVHEVYDPVSNRWETKSPVPTARNHAAIGAVGGKLYVIGGRVGAANVANWISSGTDVVEEYDPAADRWRAMSKMPTARSGQGWATYRGRIYVIGGELRDYHADAVFRDVEAFDPAANVWHRLLPMPTARHGVVVAALESRLHVIGGHLAFAGTGGGNLHSPAHEVFEFTVN